MLEATRMPSQQKQLSLMQDGHLDTDKILGALLRLLQCVGIDDRQGPLQSELAAHKDMPGIGITFSDNLRLAICKGLATHSRRLAAPAISIIVDKIATAHGV